MLWLIFALLTAFFESLKDVFSKKCLRESKSNEYVLAWALPCFALPFLLPALLFTGIPALGTRFWLALFSGSTLYVVTLIMYMRAIKISELSITVPMLTFTPLFMLVTSPLIVGEFPNVGGIIGILMIVAGSYLLNVSKKVHGYFAPFKALVSDKGARLMLLVAFIWSITSNIDKIGLLNSSPLFWVIAVDSVAALLLLPLVIAIARKEQISMNGQGLLKVGLFGGLTSISQMTAISLTLVAYVIAVKRTSAIMGVIFGYSIFKESGIKERLSGVMVMITGVLFITLSQGI